MENTTDYHQGRFIRVRELVEMLGVSQSTLYNWIRDGRFPPLVKLGPRTSGLPSEDYEAWRKARKGEAAASA